MKNGIELGKPLEQHLLYKEDSKRHCYRLAVQQCWKPELCREVVEVVE